MAKDGTARGGARIRSGPSSKKKTDAFDAGFTGYELPVPDELDGDDVPPVDEFLTEVQKDGSKLEAEHVYRSTYLWLKSRGCEKLVPRHLINEYAMSVARWIQAEHFVSKYGSLAMHPTVKSPVTSPYVTMSQSYMKQINNTWYQIYAIVKDSGNDVGGVVLSDDPMELLLRSKQQ